MKNISLVLGSGGARGYAHIGVIRALEERGYTIASISGASMGALVGGFYACGKLGEYEKWVRGLSTLEVAALLDLSWSRRGLIGGDRLFARLSEILGPCLIEELPLPYTAVAVDLRRAREVWFQRGPLIDAIRASIAIPSFFTPVEREGMLLVDGGALNPLPVAPTMSDHTEMTIAVDLYGDEPPPGQKTRESSSQLLETLLRRKKKAKSSRRSQENYHLFDIIDRTIETMQKTLTNYRLGGYPPDLLIRIPKEVCGAYDFHRADEVIPVGYQKAMEVLESGDFSAPGKPIASGSPSSRDAQ